MYFLVFNAYIVYYFREKAARAKLAVSLIFDRS